ncbi:hypothetical protein [Sphingomonas sp.]|uniref:hypothetical protein n=1 Tax=Sphingomonas sp. TaxID=28214 RepID=UPI003B00E117
MKQTAAQKPRSFDRFEEEDLNYLLASALDDLCSFEARHQHHRGLAATLVCVALCQGAARHLVDGEGGVHDFDVWSFFRAEDGRPAFPVRRRASRPFEGSRFTGSSRRIDLLGRSIIDLGSARTSLTDYLRSGRTATAKALSERPAYILHPISERGPLPRLSPF